MMISSEVRAPCAPPSLLSFFLPTPTTFMVTRLGSPAAVAVACSLFAVAMFQYTASAEPVVVLPPAPPPLLPMSADEITVPLVIHRGSTIGQLMSDVGLSHRPVLEAAKPFYDLTRIRPDRELSVVYRDGEADPVAVRYQIDGDTAVVVCREGQAWTAEVDAVEYTAKTGTIAFSLTRSLWADGLEAGLRPEDLAILGRVFEYELDFNSELRDGAQFSLVAEIESAPGRPDRLGTVHAVRLVNGDRDHTAVRHESDGDEAFYHPDGTGMKRPFLRSPLEFSRVTSGFNPKRYHPVLKKQRPHNGTDFGAPTGTPVRAVADGVVTYSGTNGGHGKHVKLDHDGPYDTSYSHLSSISVKKGSRVRQGQIIGKVGSTGMSTGPHLHYQMWRNGQYVDAMRVDLPRSKALPTGQKAAFQAQVTKWLPSLDVLIEPTMVAEVD